MTEEELFELIKNPGLLDISFNNLNLAGLNINIIGNKESFYLIFF